MASFRGEFLLSGVLAPAKGRLGSTVIAHCMKPPYYVTYANSLIFKWVTLKLVL